MTRGPSLRSEKSLTEDTLVRALAARFCLPAWAFFSGVRNAAGFNANRTADGIAMSLWPSRGLEIYGFEIKVSRGDWLSEMRNPAKADDVFCYCDRWFLVAASRELVKAGELPPTWGLMVPRGDGLECVKEAPKNPAPELDRSFVAVLLKKVLDKQPDKVALAAGIAEAEARWDSQHEREITRLRDANEIQARELDGLKNALGARYHDPEKIAEAVRTVLNGGLSAMIGKLAYLGKEARQIAERAEATSEILAEPKGTEP